MRIFLLIFTFFNIISISLNTYTYDSISELVPKNIIFETNYYSYIIFKYIPSCNNNKFNSQNNIYVQLLLKPLNTIFLYIYTDFSNISQDINSIFINYDSLYRISYSSSILLTNLVCGQEYYFVFYKTPGDITDYPFYFKVTIIDGNKDFIEISAGLSDHYSIYQRTEKEEQILYTYTTRKYALINFNRLGRLKIVENENILYDNESLSFSEIYEFKENTIYNITYKTDSLITPINFQFFDQPKTFKFDYKKGPMILYNYKYYFEIDISDFTVGENILLYFYAIHNSYHILYQFKSNFKGNNYIDLGEYYSLNYIPIKKTNVESTLIIYIQFNDYYMFSLFNVISSKVEEITEEKTLSITGPIYYILDYYSLNNICSIGIESNEPFFLFEYNIGYQTKIVNTYYVNVYFTKYNNLEPHIFKKAIIFYNSTKSARLKIKKLDFSIFEPKLDKHPENEFFQLCQGENTEKELYFYNYKDSISINSDYLFTSVFGDFNTFFKRENEINNISDFNFDTIGTNNFYQFDDENNGYLKINCTNPTMIKHSKISYNYETELNQGQRYYIKNSDIKNSRKYGFAQKSVNNNFSIKFTIFGLRRNQTIHISFDNKKYEINDYDSILEINNYNYKYYSTETFFFECGEEITNSLMAEIIVSFIPEELDEKYQLIDFVDSFGTLSINSSEGLLIKIPKDLNEDLYDFSILLLNTTNNDIQISYDSIKYLVPKNKVVYQNSPIIPLFKTNPYNYISNQKSDSFLYILIYNLNYNAREILIKKPKLYSDINLNEINTLPQATEDDKKYYYQIPLPEEGNYNFLKAQAIKTNNAVKMTLSINSIHFPLINNYEIFYHHFNIPIYAKNKKIYLNYFEIDPYPGYINLVAENQKNYPSIYPYISLNPQIEQINGKNKIKIKMNSLSYVSIPNIYKYYLLFNVDNSSVNYYPILTGENAVNATEYQIMEIINDDGSQEYLEFDIDININLKLDNYLQINNSNIFFIPINSENNLLELFLMTQKGFKYNNYNKNKKVSLAVIIVIFVVIILVSGFFVFYINIGKELIQKYKDKKLLKEEVQIDKKEKKSKSKSKKK